MTLSLAYNDDLGRVQITASGLPDIGAVRVERSVNGLLWTTVRGASALPVEDGSVSVDDYEFVADRENHYRVTGGADSGLNLPGEAGAYASTPETGQEITGAADSSSQTPIFDEAVAPSVDADAAGVLVCGWVTFEYTSPPYVPPAGMTEVAHMAGEEWSQVLVATEPIAGAGATGTRSASNGIGDAWSAVSVAIPAGVVDDVQSALLNDMDWSEETPGPEVTTATAAAGDWLIAIGASDYDPTGTMVPPSGAGWMLLSDSGPASNAPRVMAWAREVTAPGPQEVQLALTGSSSTTFLTVLVVSGVEIQESLNVDGDLRIRVGASLDSWASGGFQVLAAKYDFAGGDRSYGLSVGPRGLLRFNRSPDGSAVVTANSTEPVPVSSGPLAVGVTYYRGTGDVQFWTASAFSAAWMQLGGTVATAPGPIHASAAPLEVGSWGMGAADFAHGVIREVEVLDGVRVVADPVFSDQPTGTEVFGDSVGNEWSVHGGALIVGGTIFEESITPSLGGRAWLKSIKHPFLNRPIHRALAGGGQDIGRAWRGGIHEVQGRSAPIAVTDIRSSREFTLTVQVPDEQAAAEMDLILASGDVFFIQVPPELAPHMAGGYVRIGATAQHRVADTIMWRFTLPCKVVAPPGPGVVGAPLTWGTVFSLYGSYEAMWAANPTWADLLSTVGSPDDLVVLP